MSNVITFYSYKGGVGRTMALANVSIMLARWGHKVLVVDWDLEAPGLEHFYKGFITDMSEVEGKTGVIDLLEMGTDLQWKDCIVPIQQIPGTSSPLHLITSGRRDEDYFKRVRSFDVDTYYENNGGDNIEQLRNDWLAAYDFVLIDSRTGITEIGGICTIQLPDIVVMLFTATNHGFDGALDIIKRAGAAQQKLPYDRQRLAFLPVPSKFETNTEFILSKQWLDTFANKLVDTYDEWLPLSVNKRDFLELTKVPYISYFSFGEKLPVIEQGVNDPSGLGYAYETIAVLLANSLAGAEQFIANRELYVSSINKNPDKVPIQTNHNRVTTVLSELKRRLNIREEKVLIHKTDKIVQERFEDSIFPMLEFLWIRVQEVAVLFRGTEQCYFASSSKYSIETFKRLLNIITANRKEYNFSYIIYLTKFRVDEEINLSIRINIEFYDNFYTLSVNDDEYYKEKLYHETFTQPEMDEFSETVILKALNDLKV